MSWGIVALLGVIRHALVNGGVGHVQLKHNPRPKKSGKLRVRQGDKSAFYSMQCHQAGQPHSQHARPAYTV